jgi:hypothetical protein
VSLTWRNTAVVTATSMSAKNGIKGRFRTPMSRSEGRRKRFVSRRPQGSYFFGLRLPQRLETIFELCLLPAAAVGMERILVVEMNLGQYVQEIRRVFCNQRVDFYGKMSGQLISPHRNHRGGDSWIASLTPII